MNVLPEEKYRGLAKSKDLPGNEKKVQLKLNDKHIGLKNPKDFEMTTGRPHGSNQKDIQRSAGASRSMPHVSKPGSGTGGHLGGGAEYLEDEYKSIIKRRRK